MDAIDRMFAEDKPALARYNLKDCELVTRIFDKTELLTFLLERATMTGLAADRSGARWRPSPTSTCRACTGSATSPQPRRTARRGQPGGFVMDSRPGLYDSVLVLDYKSLYPPSSVPS